MIRKDGSRHAEAPQIPRLKLLLHTLPSDTGDIAVENGGTVDSRRHDPSAEVAPSTVYINVSRGRHDFQGGSGRTEDIALDVDASELTHEVGTRDLAGRASTRRERKSSSNRIAAHGTGCVDDVSVIRVADGAVRDLRAGREQRCPRCGSDGRSSRLTL